MWSYKINKQLNHVTLEKDGEAFSTYQKQSGADAQKALVWLFQTASLVMTDISDADEIASFGVMISGIIRDLTATSQDV
jgi:hypothetical protein